jgi:hypothetical protein
MATSSNYYIDAATFATATAVFMNQGLSVLAPDGIYSFGSTTRQQSGGVLLTPQACSSCTPDVATLNGSDYESCITEEISDTFIVTGGSFKFYVYAVTDIGEESINTVGRIRSYDGVSWNEIYAASIQAYDISNGEYADTSSTDFIILPPGNYQYTVYINSFCQSGCCGGFVIEPA